jgi:hypothetical protein
MMAGPQDSAPSAELRRPLNIWPNMAHQAFYTGRSHSQFNLPNVKCKYDPFFEKGSEHQI